MSKHSVYLSMLFLLRSLLLKEFDYVLEFLDKSVLKVGIDQWMCTKYLATDSGGYVNEYSSRNNCSVAKCFSEKPRWRWNKQVCQG